MDRRRAVGTVGVLAIASALVVAVLAVEDTPATPQLAGLLAVMVALGSGYVLRRSGASPSTGTRFDGPTRAGTPGARFDRLANRAINGDPDAGQQVRATLRQAAIATVAAETDRSTDAAREAVATGAWTDDPVAQAVLAERTAGPLADRLRLWYAPAAERERRIRRTVQAIRAVATT
jgi:hypothetical protein